jgi:hypothetical protein
MYLHTLAVHFPRMVINMWSLMDIIAINMQRKTIILRLYVCVYVCIYIYIHTHMTDSDICIYISLSVILICYPSIHSMSHLETENVSVVTFWLMSGFLKSCSLNVFLLSFTDELSCC